MDTKHPISEYINQARTAGMSNEQIIQALTDAGWQVREILDVVMVDKPKAPLPAASGTIEPIISVHEMSKIYGQVKALDQISLEVKPGQVTALLGPNGAGKTTLVKILTTLIPPTEGQATVAGFDVIRQAQSLRAVIGLAGQYAAVDEILTGRENLEMVGRLYHLPKKAAQERATELLKQFDLEEAADRSLKTYSGGMRRRLDLAASLVIKPKVLFLDEPTTGLDPRSRFVLWDVIRDLIAAGTTVLLTTQYMEEADQLASHIFVIDHGHIIAQGSPAELKRQVGGEVLEIHLTDHSTVTRVASLISRYGTGQPNANPDTGIVTMPAEGGRGIIADVIRELDSADIKLDNIVLRQPSLDDVFMKLTGHTAEEEAK